MERQYRKEGLCRACTGRMGSLSDLPDQQYGKKETTALSERQMEDEDEDANAEGEMGEERTRGGGNRRAYGAKTSGRYMYGGAESTYGDGSDSEDSDAEYLPSSTDDEGYESEESEDTPPTRTQPKCTKRRQSSSSDIAMLIEQEVAQRGKRARR
jgi:hypothetical protein